MAKWKEGDKVKIVKREVTMEDRLSNQYFAHMGGLSGVVQNVYEKDEVAVKIDPKVLEKTAKEVHDSATKRMRAKFLENATEEQRKTLAPEELNFDVHYMLLVQSKDLEKN